MRRVLDIETMEPVIAYVWQGDNVLAITDDNGEWYAPLTFPTSVRLTAVGYKPQTANLASEAAAAELWMESVATVLDPVVVIGPPRPDPGPMAASIPWGWLALLALAALASGKPRRRS